MEEITSNDKLREIVDSIRESDSHLSHIDGAEETKAPESDEISEEVADFQPEDNLLTGFGIKRKFFCEKVMAMVNVVALSAKELDSDFVFLKQEIVSRDKKIKKLETDIETERTAVSVQRLKVEDEKAKFDQQLQAQTNMWETLLNTREEERSKEQRTLKMQHKEALEKLEENFEEEMKRVRQQHQQELLMAMKSRS